MVTVWLTVVGLALLFWAFASARRQPSQGSGSAESRTPERDIDSERGKHGTGSRRAALPKIAVPGFDDPDDLEITVITASPFSTPPAAPQVGKVEDDDGSEASTVNVIYGEEADIEEVTLPFARILVSAEGESDRGRSRGRNEDSFLVLRERSLFAVADGMGGYDGGHVASALAVDTLRHAFEHNVFKAKTESSTPVPKRGRELACAMQMANQAILAGARADAHLSRMGTTLVAARFSPNKQRVYIGHVGDSRCYRLRGEVFRQLTTDHTLGELGLRGPVSHHLFQAVGIRPTMTIDLIVDKPRANDVYLLCSDGLTKMAQVDEIRAILSSEPDLEAAVYSLIELANDRGGKDNVTVILVKVIDRTQPLPALLAAKAASDPSD